MFANIVDVISLTNLNFTKFFVNLFVGAHKPLKIVHVFVSGMLHIHHHTTMSINKTLFKVNE